MAQKEYSEPIWTHFGGTRTMPNHADPMRCALGHGSSPFLRIGAIHGVPGESREFSFDPCHQQLHRLTLNQSPVSSRDLARSGLFDELEGPADHLHRRQRPRERDPAACLERLHRFSRYRRWNRSEATPWPETAVTTATVLTASTRPDDQFQRRRAWLAGVISRLPHALEHHI